jgi:hypothetical protein
LTSIATPTYFQNEVNARVTAGSTYRIAVDGQLDSAAGIASMGQLTFLIYMTVPSPDPQTSNPFQAVPLVADLTPPRTTIVKRDIRPGKRRATFGFRSNEAAGAFLCKLDGRKAASCGSPKAYTGLAVGPHTFKVRAIDSTGNADPAPATARFSIAPVGPKHK